MKTGCGGSFVSAMAGIFTLIYVCVSHGTELTVPDENQMYSNWCWAAVAASILAIYVDSPPSQCEIVNEEMRLNGFGDDTTDCCEIPHVYDLNDPCNHVNELYDTPGSISDILNLYDIPHEIVFGPLHFEEVVDVTDQQRPFIIHWTMLPGIGHFLLGYGYHAESESVLFANPYPNEFEGFKPYSWVLSGTSDTGVTHRWAHTLLLSKPSQAEIQDAGLFPFDKGSEMRQEKGEMVTNGGCVVTAVGPRARAMDMISMFCFSYL